MLIQTVALFKEQDHLPVILPKVTNNGEKCNQTENLTGKESNEFEAKTLLAAGTTTIELSNEVAHKIHGGKDKVWPHSFCT